MAASYFLLLAQKKVTKENGTLGAVPLAARGVRYGWTGFFYRPSWPVEKIGAIPRAARVRRTRLVRPPSATPLEGTQEQERSAKTKRSRRVGYIRCFCGRDCRALRSSRAPLGRGEQAEDLVARSAIAGRRPATLLLYTDVLSAKPAACSRSLPAGMPANRGREGALFFGYFLLGKQKKVTGDQGWSTKNTRT